jgi:hypothetical protein
MTKPTKSIDGMLGALRSVNEQSLRQVSSSYSDGSLDKVLLDFGTTVLVISADENDDSIDVTITSGLTTLGENLNSQQQGLWNQFIGKRLGWGWVTINQQGYCDGLLLSFGDITPKLVVNVVASSIKVATISAFA